MNWITSLFSSSPFWEGVEYAAEGVVIAGALIEVLADFEHILKGDENRDLRHRVAKQAAIALIIGLAIELSALVRTNQLFTETIATLYGQARDASDRAETASKQATTAQNRADKAERESSLAIISASVNAKEAARLNKEAESEHLARVKIEARVAWRRLTERQKADIGSALGRRFSDQGVSFWYNAGDTETSWFAADLAEAVQAAHTLRVYPPGGMMTMMESGRLGGPVRRDETGVIVQSTRDERSRELADAIIHELTVRGFDAARPTDPPFDPNPVPQVWVTVNPHPDGPQGDFKLAAQQVGSSKPPTK